MPQPATSSSTIASRGNPTCRWATSRVLTSATNYALLALPTYSNNPMYRAVLIGSVSYFTTTHDIKAGYSMNYAKRTGNVYSTSVTCGPSIATGFRIASTRTTRRSSSVTQDREQGLYIQDRWRPTRKLTLNLGLRYETNYGWMPETCQPQTAFIAARCFDPVNGAPDWKAVNPRFSVVYDLMGDGSTALKFAANRYVVPVGVQVVGRVNPVSAVSDTRQWLPQSRCGEAATLGCDRNDDLTPQINELGPSNGYPIGTSNRYEPGYDWPNANEYTVEVQRQLPGNLVISGGYTRREKRNQLGVRNVAVPMDTYIPLNVVEATSGQAVTVYNQNPALRGRVDNLWDNDPEMDSTYNGGDITLNKRLSNQLDDDRRSQRWQERRVCGCGGSQQPELETVQPWHSGRRRAGVVPHVRAVQAAVRHFAQRVLSIPERIPGARRPCRSANNTVALTQATQAVIVNERGDVRYPSLNQVDFSLRRAFRMGGSRVLQPRLDIYNMTNNATIRTWVTQMGNTYHRPSAIQRGTLIKLGFNYDF